MEGLEKPENSLDKIKARLDSLNAEIDARKADKQYDKVKEELSGVFQEIFEGMMNLNSVPGSEEHRKDLISRGEEAIEKLRAFERDELGLSEDSTQVKDALEDLVFLRRFV